MKYFKKILNNCDEVSLLILKNKEIPTSIKSKVEVLFHLAFCKCCKNFEKQSIKIDNALLSFQKNIDKKPPYLASQSFKDNLKTLIKE